MTENNQQPGAADAPENEEAQNSAALPEWARKELAEARREAAKHRVAKKQAEDAANSAQEQALADQAKWKELAEKRQRDLEGLTPLKDRLAAYETAFTTALQKRLEAIPDQFKTLVPEFDDPVKTWGWLDANQNLFAARKAPGLDAGAQGDASKNAPKLTDIELQIARAPGLTPDVYAKRKAEIDAARRNPPKE